MSGYILDDLALAAGLAGVGSEHHRRELSRLLLAAIDGGPTLDVPALCLAEAAAVRPAVVSHLADIIATAPDGTIDVSGFRRAPDLDAMRSENPQLSWPATHAVLEAVAAGLPIVTVDPRRYKGAPVDALAL